MSWAATVLTLFPGMFPGPLGHSLPGKALSNGLWSLDARDIRIYYATTVGEARTLNGACATSAGTAASIAVRASSARAASS